MARDKVSEELWRALRELESGVAGFRRGLDALGLPDPEDKREAKNDE